MQHVSKGGIGFGGAHDGIGDADSYAYLEDEHIESKIGDELRDHPLLLLPRDKRRELMATHLASEISGGFLGQRATSTTAICPIATARYSKRYWLRTTAIWPGFCATCRSNGFLFRAATGNP